MVHWRREAERWLSAQRASRAVRIVSYYDRILEDIDPDLFSTIVLDEIHLCKTPGAIRTRRACRLLHQATGRAWGLSGTIVPNRPVELWPVMLALGLLPPEYQAWEAFTERFCGPKETPWGIDVTGASNLHELRELLRPHVLRRTKAEVMPELPPKTWRVLALDLPLAHREKDLDRHELARLREPVAFEALSDVLREHGRRKVAPAVDHIQGLLEEEDKVVVFAHHREVLRDLAACLADYNPAVVVGGQGRAVRQAEVDRFQADPTCRLYIGSIKIAGVGLTLTAAQRVVLVEASWVPADLEQAADRCHRLGQRRQVSIDVLVINASVDEHMVRRALEKVEVIRQIVPGDGGMLGQAEGSSLE